MEASGRFNFMASTHNELSIRRGDIIKILGEESGWYKAEINGKEGYVPRNYVDVKIPEWFRETDTRDDAEEFLRDKEDGEFVVRGCQSSPSEFSISVKHKRTVHHFRVMRNSKGQYYLWSEKFNSLNKLVEFYRTNSISKTKQIFLAVLNSDIKFYSLMQKPSTIMVRALYDFIPEEDDELAFRAGDVIEVMDQSNPCWWRGSLRGHTGLFPANYTKTL